MSILGSPVFILLVSSVRIFTVLALSGHFVLSGIAQILALFLMMKAQWKQTRRMRPPARITAAVAAYLMANLIFTIVVFGFL
jgi:hypothetical protein